MSVEDYFPIGDEDFEDDGRLPPVRCKYCHVFPLYWDQPFPAPDPKTKRKWKLMTPTGALHFCTAFIRD